VTPPAPLTSRVGDEVSSLDEARAALRRGDAATALRLLDAHDARFAGGDLAQEAALVRVQTLVSQGDDARAAAAAKRFLQVYPASPYAPSVRRIAGDTH
jgi:outer membrane protein assembly factor BamD (BamD/ComL family)